MSATPEQAKLPWAYVGLVVLPILAFVTFEALLDWYAQVPVNGPIEDSSELACRPNPELAPISTWLKADKRWPEAAARLQLLAMTALYSLFALGVIFKFGWDLWQLFCNAARLRLLAAYGICIAVGVLYFLWAHWWEALPRATHFLGSPLFADALNEAAKYGPPTWGVCTFKRHLNLTSGLALLSIPAFIAGGISCLARISRLSEKESWIYQTERLKTYLYMSAGLLVLGVLYLRALTSYPSFLLASDGTKQAFTALAHTLTMYTGIEFSIILASYALPVAWLLSRQADTIAAKIAAHEDTGQTGAVASSIKVQQVREREKLVFSTRDGLNLIVALLAPFITGALPSLTTAIG